MATSLTKEVWFAGKISKQECDTILMNASELISVGLTIPSLMHSCFPLFPFSQHLPKFLFLSLFLYKKSKQRNESSPPLVLGVPDTSFVVRESESAAGTYTLALKSEMSIRNFRIQNVHPHFYHSLNLPLLCFISLSYWSKKYMHL